MKALANVHPVTHAIGNTLRRVIIMLVCMLVFRTPMTLLGAVGSACAIGGSYLYAMTTQREKQKALAAASAAARGAAASKATPAAGGSEPRQARVIYHLRSGSSKIAPDEAGYAPSRVRDWAPCLRGCWCYSTHIWYTLRVSFGYAIHRMGTCDAS